MAKRKALTGSAMKGLIKSHCHWRRVSELSTKFARFKHARVTEEHAMTKFARYWRHW